MRRTTALGLLAAAAFPVAAEEPAVVLRVEGALTTASEKDAGFYPNYRHQHTVPLRAGRAYRVDLVSKDFSPSLSVQDAARQRGPVAGINPKPDDRSLARLVYIPVKDGDHAVTAQADGKSTGAYTLTVRDVTDREDEIVDFQLNHLYRLDAADRKRVLANLQRRYAAAGAKLTAADVDTAEFVARGLENTPDERAAYEGFAKVFAASGSPVAARAAERLDARGKGRARFLSLPGKPLALRGTTTDGKAWDVKDQKGKVVLVYFWYAGAGVLDAVREAHAAYAGRLTVVGLNLDATKADLDRSLKRAMDSWPTPSGLDTSEGPAKRFGDLAVTLGGSMPVILVDAEGKVVSTDAGGVEMPGLLDKLLGPAAKKP